MTTHSQPHPEVEAKTTPLGTRYFIRMGTPGFNSSANNRNGYATQAAALAAIRYYSPVERLAQRLRVDAVGDYRKHSKRVTAAQVALAHLLTEHRKKHEAKPLRWDLAGDLSRVAHLLEEAVTFLRTDTYAVTDRNGNPTRVTVPTKEEERCTCGHPNCGWCA